MWPGIALTERRGAVCLPVAGDAARFWITRLHGPATNDSPAQRSLAVAAQKLSQDDEAGAQRALDASGFNRLSSDGAVLMRAVAGSLGIAPLDLPWADGPRLWRKEDIAAHPPLFREFGLPRMRSRRREPETIPTSIRCPPGYLGGLPRGYRSDRIAN